MKHTFVSPKPDGGDVTLVRPSDWNAEHALEPFALANQLQIGRSFSVIRDECFYLSETAFYEGGILKLGSGTGNATFGAPSDASHPGVIACNTGTTTTGRCALGGQSTESALLGGGRARFGTVVKPTSLSTATEAFTVQMGWGDGLTLAGPIDGVLFRYTHSVNGGRWEGMARSFNAETALDTGVLADTSWHAFEIEVNAVGTVAEFFVDGVSRGTVVSNIPVGAGRETGMDPVNIMKSAGTTARTVWIDAYWYIYEFTTPR